MLMLFNSLNGSNIPQKRQDAYKILKLVEHTSGFPPKMPGASIIGFGSYHYIYKTSHKGDAPLVDFSPRKTKVILYFATGHEDRGPMLEKFGKHTSGKDCISINKIEDINLEVLK